MLRAQEANESGKRYAVLVGVKKYDHPKEFKSLKYTENDVRDFAKVLRGEGYSVVVLSDSTGEQNADLIPTRANILDQLKSVLGRCQRDDLILVGLAGHGLEAEAGSDKQFFCPREATRADEGRLIAMKEIYELMGECRAWTKFMLVDACRDDPETSLGLNAGSAPLPPRGMGVMFSCSAGELSREPDALQHGVFFHHVLEGFQGRASDPERGAITWDSLSAYVRKTVPVVVLDLVGGGAKQNPNEVANLSKASPILAWPVGTNELQQAKLAYSQRQTDEALRLCGEALRLNPSLAKAWDHRGAFHLSKGDTTQAVADFTEAIRLNPTFDNAYTNRAIAHYVTGNHAATVADCNEAMKRGVVNAKLLAVRGDAYLQLKNYEEAIASMTIATALDPKRADCYLVRSRAYRAKGDLPRARADLATARQLDPSIPAE